VGKSNKRRLAWRIIISVRVNNNIIIYLRKGEREYRAGRDKKGKRK